MPLESPSGYGAGPTSSLNVHKVWLVATLLPLFVCLAVALDKHDSMRPFSEAASIPMEHYSHCFCRKLTIF